MLRLLVVAPTCDERDVGEAWVAFQWVKLLAEGYDVSVLTYHKRGSMPLSQQLPNVRVVEWSEARLLGRAERLNSLLKPAYIPFYLRARRWIRAELARGERFDLAHQPVPVAMRYPSPVAGLGIPLVIGPVGGSLQTPAGFAGDEDTAPWYTRLRSADAWRVRHDPLLRRTYEDASCVLGIAPYVQDFLRPLDIFRFEVMSETGLETLPDEIDRSGRAGPLRLLFVGRLVRTKGARDAVRAMALLHSLPVVLDIVGDGFDRAECERLARALGVAERVNFHGKRPRAEIDEFYRAADVFVFPSYREPGGNVVFEAMGYGLPLVVSDRGGPGAAVDKSCALTISPVDPESFASGIAEAVKQLARDEKLRRRMGQAARRRVADVGLWQGKASAVSEIYHDVVDRVR